MGHRNAVLTLDPNGMTYRQIRLYAFGFHIQSIPNFFAFSTAWRRLLTLSFW
jgi:hypothetical protein